MKSVQLLIASLALALVASSCGNNASNPASPGVPTDGAPLVAPTDLTTGRSDINGMDVLRFTPSSSPSVSGYEVYQYSPDPVRDNSYVLQVTLRGNIHEYELPAAPDQTLEYWRVVAVADNGGRSPESGTLTVRRHEPGIGGKTDIERGPHPIVVDGD